jgi:hypothetical protein
VVGGTGNGVNRSWLKVPNRMADVFVINGMPIWMTPMTVPPGGLDRAPADPHGLRRLVFCHVEVVAEHERLALPVRQPLSARSTKVPGKITGFGTNGPSAHVDQGSIPINEDAV